MDITEIRRRYPHPKSVHAAGVQTDIDYCVGGALCQAHAELWDGGHYSFAPHFPSSWALRGMLLKINPTLPPEEATAYADAITSANDLGRFEEAWQRAGQALTPQRKED